MTDVAALDVSVAVEYSITPGPRSEAEGEFSGERFLAELLEPRFLEARGQGRKLRVDLDGTAGYATSFLEAAFGGLARKYGAAAVQSIIEVKSEEEPHLLREVEKYVREAEAA